MRINSKPSLKTLRVAERGNIFLALFGAVAIVGAIGVTSTTVMRGPMKNMTDTSARAVSENQIMANTKLAVMSIARAPEKDCDRDGMVEPWEFEVAGAGVRFPVGGGILPAGVSAMYQEDAWGNAYGYCVWDHGTLVDDALCGGAGQNRLPGLNDPNAQGETVVAVMSAGADRVFQTTCQDWATADATGTPLVNKPTGSDDLIMSYTYAEAALATSSKWQLQSTAAGTDATTAEITEDKVEIGGNSLISGRVDTAGLKLASDPGDDSISGPCNSANDQALRLNTGATSTILEMCDFAGTGNWGAVSGTSSSNSCTIETGQLSIRNSYTNLASIDGANGITIVGDLAYVASLSADSLTILNISDPDNIIELGSYNSANLDGAVSVQVQGDNAYVGANGTKSLTSLNISDPNNIVELDNITDGANFGNIYDFEIKGNYAYLPVNDSDALTIIDISDPSNLTLHSSISDAKLNGAIDIRLVGDLAYVSSQYGLTIVDISDPSAASIVGDVALSGSGRAVAVKGNYAYVADQTNDTIRSIDISDPTAPVVVDTIVSTPNFDYMVDIFEYGNYLFVGSSGVSNGVTAINISDPADLKIDDFITDATELENPSGFFAVDDLIYVTNRSGHLTVLDIGCDLSPNVNVSTGSSIGFDPELANCQQNNGGPFVELDSLAIPHGHWVWGDGRYLYVGNDANGISAYSFDGTSLTEIATYDTAGIARKIWGDGQYIYLADGANGILALTFDGTTFTQVATYNTAGGAAHVMGDGRYFYVADTINGILALTFDGTTFTLLDTYPTNDTIRGVWTDGSYIYAAEEDDGVRVFSFDGESFTSLDFYDTENQADNVWGDGTYIYVADENGDDLKAFSFDGNSLSLISEFDVPSNAIGLWGDGTHLFTAQSALTFNGSEFEVVDSFTGPFLESVWGDGTYIYGVNPFTKTLFAFSGFECTGAGEYGIGGAFEQDFTGNQSFAQPSSSTGSIESYGTSILLKSNEYGAEAGIAFDIDTTLDDEEVPAAAITGIRAGVNGSGGLAIKTTDSTGNFDTRMFVDPQGDVGLNTFAPYNVSGKLQVNDLPSSGIDYFNPDTGNCVANSGGPLVEAGALVTAGLASGIWSDGNNVFVADNTNGLKVYNFDGTTFTEVGSFATMGSPYKVWGRDGFIFIADGAGGISAYTFDGTTLTQVAIEAVTGGARDIWSDGDYFYVASEGAGIHAYTFDGTSFTLVDTYDTANLAWEVWGDGEYIYLADHGDGIYAFTFDGSSFSLITIEDTAVSANSIWSDGNYFYVADLAGGVLAFEFNGSEFTLLDTYSTPEQVFNVIGDGVNIYAAAGLNGMYVLSFDGTSFSLVESLDSPGYALTPFNDGSYLYLADSNDIIAYSGYECLSINGWQGPTNGLLVGAEDALNLNFDPELKNCTKSAGGPFVEIASFDTPGRGLGVWSDDEYVYVADRDGGIRVYSFDGTTLTEIDSDITPGTAYGVWGDGEYIYVADYEGGILAYSFDGITLTALDQFDTTGFLQSVWGDGEYIYAGGGPAGIHAFTFDGKKLTEVTVFDTTSSAIEVSGDGTYIYIGDQASGVRAFTFDGVAFTEVGFFDTSGEAYGAWSDGEYVYVADGSAGIIVFKFDGTTFTQLDSIDTPDSAEFIWGDGQYIYLADGTSGVYAYTFDGTNLIEVDNIDTPASTQNIWGDGQYLYVADWASGVRVYSGFECLAGSVSFFGLDGQGDVDANILYSNNLKIAETSTDGNTITDIMSLSPTGKATLTQDDIELIDEASAFNFFSWSKEASEHNSLILNRARGTMSAPTPLQDGDIVGSLGFAGYDGATIAAGQNAAIYGKVNGAVSSTNVPIDLYFSTDSGGNAIGSSDMVFTQAGLLGVGTETPLETLHASQRITFDNGLRMGNDNQCSVADDQGVLKFTGSAFEYCDTGSGWVNLVDGASSAPNPFNTDLANCTVNEGGPFVEVTSYDTTGSAYDVWSDGTYYYVADGPSNDILAFNFDGATLTLIDNIDLGATVDDVWGDGTYIYASVGGNGVYALTFDGATLTQVGNYNTTGQVYDVWGDGTHLFVADRASGIHAFSFDGTTFTLIDTFNTPGGARQTWGDGTYLYVADWVSGIRAYTFDGTSFTEIASFDTSGTANHVWGDGQYIYLADWTSGIRAFNFDGVEFTELDFNDIEGGTALTIWGDGEYIYVSDITDGVKTYSFNGKKFNLIEDFSTPDISSDIWGDGTYMYVADRASGFRVYSGYKCLSTAEQKPDFIDWRNIEKTETKIFPVDGGSSDEYGSRLTASGNYLIAGALGDDDNGTDSGSVYVHDIVSGAQIHKLTASDGAANDRYANDVSADGNYLAVGAYWSDFGGWDRSGAVYVYDLTSGAELYKLNTPRNQSQPFFGGCVLVTGDYLVVCEERDNHDGIIDNGSAHVYEVATGEYLYEISPDDLVASDQFGSRITGHGKYVLISAEQGDGIVGNTGTAYLYNIETGVLLHKFEAADGAVSDAYGSGALNDNYVTIGSPLDDDNGADSGSVYVYDLETGNQLYKLTPNDPNAGDKFGFNMDISGNYLFVNSEGYNSTQGAVHIFNLTTGEEIDRITGSDATAANDKFGDEMVVLGNTLIVGSQQGPGNTADSGAVYVYRGRWEDRQRSDTDCYPHPIIFENITDVTTNTDITTEAYTLRSFARECRLTLASESDTIDIIKNSVPVGTSFVDVQAGDVIELEIRSSSSAGASVKNIVTLGDQRASFTVTTAP